MGISQRTEKIDAVLWATTANPAFAPLRPASVLTLVLHFTLFHHQKNKDLPACGLQFGARGGKGPASPETEYGADAVIEIVVRNEFGETVATKILPIQNKKEKIYSNRTLAKQAERLSKLPGGGLIVSFSEHGFTSCEGHIVADADGKWWAIPENLKADFGHTLAKDFLPCKIGSRDLVYDARGEIFRTVDGHELRLPVRRRITTACPKPSLRLSAAPRRSSL